MPEHSSMVQYRRLRDAREEDEVTRLRAALEHVKAISGQASGMLLSDAPFKVIHTIAEEALNAG